MLVLTRNEGEYLTIGEPESDSEIIVRVVEIRGNQVRIGIEAPKHIPVHRAEIAERIRRQRDEARAVLGTVPGVGPGGANNDRQH